MEINAEKEFQLLRQHRATSALWFLWVLKEGRGRLAWSALHHGPVDDPRPLVDPCPWPLHAHPPGGQAGAPVQTKPQLAGLCLKAKGWPSTVWCTGTFWTCCLLVIHTSRPMLESGIWARLYVQLVGTLLPSAFGGGPPRSILPQCTSVK